MDMKTSPTRDIEARKPTRVRHEIRFRALTVARIDKLTPHLLRLTLQGDDLANFASPGFDDHVKLALPDAQGRIARPVFGPDGPSFPNGRPTMRDYTPRNYDAAARTLDIEFALHDAGPATAWAMNAKVGDEIAIAGPRGSFIVPLDFDAHVLVGDDTALPAIARRLAELPQGAKALVFAEVDSAADEIVFETKADAKVTWLHRQGQEAGTTSLLVDAVCAAALPEGDAYVWIGCESATAKALRAVFIEKGQPGAWMKAAGYWKRGDPGAHETHGD